MVDDINFDGVFSTGIIKATSWGSVTRQEMEKVWSVAKNTREELIALINESIDTSTTLGSQNYNALRDWNIASKNGGDAAKVYNESSDALKEYLDTCSSGEATWEGFVAHQKKAAAGLQSMTVGAKAAAAGMKVLNAAMNMLIMWAIQEVIQLIVKGLDNLIHEQEKLHEEAEEARKQYEETVSELEAQEEALSNVKAQLIALESISTPTLADQAQTEELKKQNTQLAVQVEYLKQKAEIEKQEKEKSEDKEWNKFKNGGTLASLAASITNLGSASNSSAPKMAASDFSYYAQYLEKVYWLKDAENEYNELVANGYSEASEARRKELEENISDYKSEILTITKSIEGNESEEAQAFIKQRTYLLADAAGKAALLKSELSSLGVNDDAVESIEKIANSSKTVEEFKTGVTSMIGKDAYTELENLAGGAEELAEAFAKVSSGSHASEDELKRFGGIVNDIFSDTEKMSTLFDEDGNVIAENISSMFDGASDELKDNIGTILQQWKEGAIDADRAKEAFNAAFNLESIQAESAKVIAKFNDAFGGGVSGVDGLINSFEELSAALKAVSESYDLLNGAIEEQNANGYISLETGLKLIESGVDYNDCLEATAGKLRLKTDATKKVVEDQIAAIKASVAQAKSEAQLRLNLLNLAVDMKPASEIMSKLLIPALTSVGKTLAYVGSIAGSIEDKDYKNMFTRASEVASNVEKNLKDDMVTLKTSISDSVLSQIEATQNELKNLNEMEKMVSGLNYSNWSTIYDTPSTSSSSSSGDAKLNAWKELLAQKKHQLEMEQITEEEYYSWLEANYKKQLNDAKKYADEWREYEETLYKWKKQKRLDDWNDAVDAKKHELEMDKIDETEYYEWLARNYKSFLSGSYAEYIEERKKVEEDLYNFEKEKAEDAQEALEDLIDLRIDMLKQEKENEKDNLKERQDNIKDFYDEQRDLLKEHYDKIDKEKERREKRKAVTDIQAELLELEADDSVEAQKRRLELEEELSEAKEDLNDFERDEELEQAEKMYDDLEEMQVEYYDKQIEYIEDYLDNAYELRQQAIKDLQDGNAQLYQEMIEYNRLYGSGIDSEITSKWDAAYEALNRYNKLLDDTYGIKLENTTGNTSKTYIPYDKLPEDKTSSALSAAQKVSSTSKGNTSTTTKKAAPAVGSKVTVKTTATNFSPKSNSVKMSKSVPGSTYIVYQTSGNQVLIGLSDNRYTGWVYQSDLKGYSSGTKNAKGGLSVVDENGSEYILGNPTKGRYQFLNGGDKVFNAKASDFLYKWANQPAEMLSSMVGSLTTSSAVSIASPCNINIGDINISGNADEKTVGELRKARKELVTEILTEFKKMKK